MDIKITDEHLAICIKAISCAVSDSTENVINVLLKRAIVAFMTELQQKELSSPEIFDSLIKIDLETIYIKAPELVKRIRKLACNPGKTPKSITLLLLGLGADYNDALMKGGRIIFPEELEAIEKRL